MILNEGVKDCDGRRLFLTTNVFERSKHRRAVRELSRRQGTAEEARRLSNATHDKIPGGV